MSWIAIIAALIPLLVKLIEWLAARKKPLTDRQKKKLAEVREKCRLLTDDITRAGVE